MTSQYLDFDIRLQRQLALQDIRLADLESIRLLLRGGSIVDWYRLNFKTLEEIDTFLRANRYDTTNPEDSDRIRYLLRAAAGYLERNFGYTFPPELVEPKDVRSVFLLPASDSPHQKLACMMLKVVHIINHIEAYELRYQLPTSDQEMFSMVEREVTECVADMRARGLGITDYVASRKTRDSLVTKLLSKRRTIAAQVFDKLRFRLVAGSREELIPVLRHMTQHLFPFNYVIPEESRNDILSFRELVESSPRLRGKINQLQFDLRLEERLRPESPNGGGLANPCTADVYHEISFVVDYPLRIDGLLQRIGPDAPRHLGRIVYLQVEFQVLDKTTFARNEAGEANHEAYKKRQRRLVLQRLVRGMPLFLRDEDREPEQPPPLSAAQPPASPSPLALRMKAIARMLENGSTEPDDGEGTDP